MRRLLFVLAVSLIIIGATARPAVGILG